MRNKSTRPLSYRLRQYAIDLRRVRRWTQREMADLLTASGYPMTQMNISQLEARHSAVSVDEAFALASLFSNGSVDALIKAAEADCSRCHGSPPEGFSCIACGAARMRGTEL